MRQLEEPERKVLGKYLLAGADRHMAILDVGTGGGRFLEELAMRGFDHLFGIDISASLLAAAGKRLSVYPVGVKLEQMDMRALTYPSESLDCVLALQQVVCGIDDPAGRRQALAECFRVLKPGGIFLCSVLDYSRRPLNLLVSLISWPFKLLKGEFRYMSYQYLPLLKLGGCWNWQYPCRRQPYAYWYRRSEILRDLRAAGFVIHETLAAERPGRHRFGLYLACGKATGGKTR